ncbi:MAG: MarC family protein [Schleiferiaceae bacterium]|jgi:multiple antibiotic resistance protein|nr:MarC family protein [Schleiferiaceae bacterium]
MEFNFTEFLSATMVLFAVIDILGSIPIIVSLRERVGHVQSEKATIVATIIMVSFLFVGKAILNVLGVDVNSFAVAGAIVIFFLALEMILGVRIYKEETPETASIVPIAFPLIAGAGTLTTLISIKAEYGTLNILLAILVNMILVYAVLKSSNRISRILGASGLGILRKVFGIILMAIAVKLFTTNISNLL